MYRIRYVHPDRPAETVDAVEHRVEGGWHVLRRDTLVVGRPRMVVALRVPVAAVAAVERVEEQVPPDVRASTKSIR